MESATPRLFQIFLHTIFHPSDTAVFKHQQFLTDPFQHISVMGNEQNRAFILIQRLFQLFPRMKIQMVGRFVQYQQIISPQDQRRQLQPGPLPQAQTLQWFPQHFSIKAQIGQHGTYFTLLPSVWRRKQIHGGL